MNSMELSEKLLELGNSLKTLNEEINILKECLRNSHLSYVRYYNNNHVINISSDDRTTFRFLMEMMIENRTKEIAQIMSQNSLEEEV